MRGTKEKAVLWETERERVGQTKTRYMYGAHAAKGKNDEKRKVVQKGEYTERIG